MHLLVVANQFDETVGGLETHLQELLPRLVERGVRVTLIYLGDGQRRTWRGVAIHPLRRRADFRSIMALPDPRDLWREWRAIAAAQRGADRVTHVATHTRFFPMSWLGVPWARRLGVPLVHTEHGGGPVATRPRAVAQLSDAVDRTLGRATLRGAQRVLAVSEASARFVRDLAGVDACVLGNGLVLNDWLPPGAPPDGERDLVFAGRFIREKGWEDFLHIAAVLRERGWAGEAIIAGAGPDEREITQRIAGLTGVRLVGRIPGSQLAPLLRGAVLVNPSTAAEGFQLIQLEAVAAGASLVGYAVGIGPELAELGDVDATVVTPGAVDELTEAVWAAVQRPAPTPAEEVLRRWDWETIADAYVTHVSNASPTAPSP